MQRVRVWLLPHQRAVPGLPRRLQCLRNEHHVRTVQLGPFAPARRDRVRCLVPRGLLLEWDRVQSVPGHLRHVCRGKRLHDLHGGVGHAFAEWHELCCDVPCGYVPVRNPVPALQQQLCRLHNHSHDMHGLPCWAGAQHVHQHVCWVLPDRLCGCEFGLQPVRLGLLRCDVPAVLVRHWRRLQPGHRGHRRVHMQHRLWAGNGRSAVQHVPVNVFPQRHRV